MTTLGTESNVISSLIKTAFDFEEAVSTLKTGMTFPLNFMPNSEKSDKIPSV